MFCNYVFLIVRIHPIFFLVWFVLLLCVFFREPKIVNGPEILDKYVGESEANIRQASAPQVNSFSGSSSTSKHVE
jgi:hypothetical protein